MNRYLDSYDTANMLEVSGWAKMKKKEKPRKPPRRLVKQWGRDSRNDLESQKE